MKKNIEMVEVRFYLKGKAIHTAFIMPEREFIRISRTMWTPQRDQLIPFVHFADRSQRQVFIRTSAIQALRVGPVDDSDLPPVESMSSETLNLVRAFVTDREYEFEIQPALPKEAAQTDSDIINNVPYIHVCEEQGYNVVFRTCEIVLLELPAKETE